VKKIVGRFTVNSIVEDSLKAFMGEYGDLSIFFLILPLLSYLTLKTMTNCLVAEL
jgi:hypothetical protein